MVSIYSNLPDIQDTLKSYGENIPSKFTVNGKNYRTINVEQSKRSTCSLLARRTLGVVLIIFSAGLLLLNKKIEDLFYSKIVKVTAVLDIPEVNATADKISNVVLKNTSDISLQKSKDGNSLTPTYIPLNSDFLTLLTQYSNIKTHFTEEEKNAFSVTLQALKDQKYFSLKYFEKLEPSSREQVLDAILYVLPNEATLENEEIYKNYASYPTKLVFLRKLITTINKIKNDFKHLNETNGVFVCKNAILLRLYESWVRTLKKDTNLENLKEKNNFYQVVLYLILSAYCVSHIQETAFDCVNKEMPEISISEFAQLILNNPENQPYRPQYAIAGFAACKAIEFFSIDNEDVLKEKLGQILLEVSQTSNLPFPEKFSEFLCQLPFATELARRVINQSDEKQLFFCKFIDENLDPIISSMVSADVNYTKKNKLLAHMENQRPPSS